jgi:predicted nucleic-acid-binding protein
VIAIDTNVLLRYLLADDASPHSKAIAIIKSPPAVLITDVVLIGAVWTLTDKALDFADALIVNKTHVVAENRVASLSALASFDKTIEQIKAVKKP